MFQKCPIDMTAARLPPWLLAVVRVRVACVGLSGYQDERAMQSIARGQLNCLADRNDNRAKFAFVHMRMSSFPASGGPGIEPPTLPLPYLPLTRQS